MENKNRKRIRIKIPEINLPSYADETKYTIIGKYILFVEAAYDQDSENPCTAMDGFGMIRSLSSKHINRIEYDDAKSLLESDQDVVPLSYYEHGNSVWFTMNSTPTPGVEFQWDGVRFAGIWIPDDSVRESYTGQDGLSRRDWMVQQAQHACETYTQWANGEVFGYTIHLHKLKTEDGNDYTDFDDYRFNKAISDDSCWGFFGWDYFEEEMTDIVRGVLSEMGFSKRAIAKALPKPEAAK